MKRYFLLLILSACAAPQSIFRPVEVDMPVAQPCSAPEIKPPDFVVAHIAPDAGLGVKMQAALVSLDQHQGYEEQLRVQLNACR
jgi:hypothetical protein